MKAFDVIGKSFDRIDGVAKATGKAVYSTDLVLPGMLFGKILRSPYTHARIIKLDVDKAKQYPGVRAVLTAKDIPNNTEYWHGDDAWILAEDEVKYIGDNVAIVAADSEAIAKEALKLIEVEYEELPHSVHLEDAVSPDSANAHSNREDNIAMPMKVVRGDIEAEFEKATVFVSRKFVFPSCHQGYMEPHSATATYEMGHLTVYCGSQVWFRLRHELAKVTGVPESDVTVRSMEIGGAFGVRNEQTIPILAALLAVKTKKPVKMTNSRQEELQGNRPSVGMEIEITIASDNEGNFLGKKVNALSDFGITDIEGAAVTWIACLRADTNYRFNSVEVTASGLYTNRPPTTSYRGFGSPQMHLALESLIDELAQKLNMSPIDIRLKNFVQPNQTSIHGYRVSSCGLNECMSKARELMDWDNKMKNKKPGHGLGVAALVHAAGSRAGEPEFGGGSAMLKLDETGKFTIYVGEAEIGQGCRTVMAQIVAEEFGVEPKNVTVVMGETDKSPFSTGTHGSKLTTVLGNAVLFACRDAKNQIQEIVRQNFGTGEVRIEDNVLIQANGQKLMDFPEAIEKICYLRSGRPIIAQGFYEPDAVVPDEGYGNIASTYLFGVQMAEVTVDQYGNIKVDKVVSVHDIGRVINPRMALGQIYGGVMQAVGFATMEDLYMTDSGIYRANTFLEYKMPTILEMPELAGGFVETIDPFGPYGAKGLAEPPIIAVAPAITNAVYDAIGVRATQIPLTPERMQKLMENKKKESSI